DSQGPFRLLSGTITSLLCDECTFSAENNTASQNLGSNSNHECNESAPWGSWPLDKGQNNNCQNCSDEECDKRNRIFKRRASPILEPKKFGKNPIDQFSQKRCAKQLHDYSRDQPAR